MGDILGLKLHRSLWAYPDGYHGVDDGAERTETRETHKIMPWRMQSDTPLIQQTSHTNVCNPAVRLSQWRCIGFFSWISCWILCFCDDGIEYKSEPSSLVTDTWTSLHGLVTQATSQPHNTFLLHDLKAVRFSLFRLVRFLGLGNSNGTWV